MPERKAKGKRRHRRGEGSTYAVNDGGWMAALPLGYDRKTGKRRSIRRRAPDQASAERALQRLQREYGKAGDIAFDRLEDYLADWLAIIEPTVSPATLVSYTGHVDNHIVPLLGSSTVGALRPPDVHRLIRHLIDGGKSAATVGRIITTLRMALQTAVRDGDLTINVAQVKLPRVSREPIEAMTPVQAQAILDAAAGDEDIPPHPFEPVYVLLLGTGMRAGEALGLDWRDVNLDDATVFVRRGKTRAATRTIPLQPFVVKALQRQRALTPRYGPDEPVFLGSRKSRITGGIERLGVSTVSHAFDRMLAAADLPEMTLHQLRHGCATLLLAQGVPMRVISEILGHANPSMTANVYAHVGADTKRSAMEQLEEILG